MLPRADGLHVPYRAPLQVRRVQLLMSTNDISPGLDAAEDARRLTAIRDVLISFDWQNGELRLALEEIDRIAFGGKP